MKPGRNDPCPCGSGRKYKHCCGAVAPAPAVAVAPTENEIGRLVALIARERPGDAEREARALLARHPDAGMVWKVLGVALLRQGKDALPALRRTAELMPQDAEVHRNLGMALYDQSRWEEALAGLQRALAIQPHHVATLTHAANALRALGRPRESLPLYRQALAVDPRSAEVHNNLGNAFLELGECADAVDSYRRALELRPDSADIHCNLGNALRQLGRFEEAIASSERAIELDATLSMAYNNLGLSLAGLGRRSEAEASYREALRLRPSYVEALSNFGLLLPELGRRHEAMAVLRQAIDLDPTRAESYRNLGNVFFEFRRIDEAAAAFREALALEPRHALTHASLGAALRMQGRTAEAEESGRAALASDPRSVAALSLLGELRADQGRFSEAEELFRQAIAIDPEYPFAYYSLASNRKMTRDDTAWLAGTRALLEKALPLRHEISLRYALGKYSDDIRDYDQAFSDCRLANETTKRYGIAYDRSRVAERIDWVINHFDATSIRRLQSDGDSSERAVFIVGMPRSGTSLIEQILASHPEVFGAGELPFWQRALAAYEEAELKSHDGASLIPRVARDYLEHMQGLSASAQRVIDKMPQNFMNLGLICAAFPRARIIHVRRHPLDTCLSIYFQYFSHLHPYANDLDNLAHYYAEYLRLSRHWRTVLAASSLLEVPYEALIEDQEGWTRRMLEFIGLPWDPKCLEFYQTDRSVITLSKWQVRQKLHTSSAGRWRNYERYLAPLQHLVGLAGEDLAAEPGRRAGS
jgi:tetratricopeptide (TPR) repeat protein